MKSQFVTISPNIQLSDVDLKAGKSTTVYCRDFPEQRIVQGLFSAGKIAFYGFIALQLWRNRGVLDNAIKKIDLFNE